MGHPRSLALLGLTVLLAGGCETRSVVAQNSGVSGFPGAQYVGLPAQGGMTAAKLAASTKDLDEPQEVELGRAVTAALGTQYPLYRNVALTHYVALVGNVVAAQSDRPDLRYSFAVLDTSEVNAFAAPGGFVLVTRGALAMMRDEATLAGVLARSVAHIALRHHVETIKKQKQTEAAKDLVMLGAQVGASRAGGSAGAASLPQTFSAAADMQVQGILRGHSRAEQMEADRIGFKYALRAGYDPAGLKDFLAAMLALGTSDTTKTFDSTHPALAERVAEQEKLLGEAPRTGARNAERYQRAVAAPINR